MEMTSRFPADGKQRWNDSFNSPTFLTDGCYLRFVLSKQTIGAASGELAVALTLAC